MNYTANKEKKNLLNQESTFKTTNNNNSNHEFITRNKLNKVNDFHNNTIEEKENEYFSMDNSLINELLIKPETEQNKLKTSQKQHNNSYNNQMYNAEDHIPSHLYNSLNTDNLKMSNMTKNLKLSDIGDHDDNSHNLNFRNKFDEKELKEVNPQSPPAHFNLYNEFKIKGERRRLIEDSEKQNIKFISKKPKISSNSQIIAINKTEKIIEEVINSYQKNNSKAISFIELGQILTDLRILREVFPKNKIEERKEFMTYKGIKHGLITTKYQEKRRKREINFYEQVWILLNPNNLSHIKMDILVECLKIVFCLASSSSVREISNMLNEFLQAAFFLSINPDEPRIVISPVTDCRMDENDVWSLEKLITEFLALKDNVLAYKTIKHFRQKSMEKIGKTQKENFSFAPNLSLTINKVGHRRTKSSNFFETRVPALISRERLRHQILDEMKKENEQLVNTLLIYFIFSKELKECTFSPAINKRSRRKSTETNNLCTYEKLYNKHDEHLRNLELKKFKKAKENELEELEGCTFSPKINRRKT